MLEKDNSELFEQELERQREESVEGSDRGRGSRGLPGRQVPRMESALNPAVTKGRLSIKLLSVAAESESPHATRTGGREERGSG